MAEILKELARYEVSPSSGFLPTSAPLERLPHAYYEPWETLGSLLPHLIKDGVHRDHIAVLPLLTTTFLSTVEEWRRAYVVLGYLSNAYIFCHHPPSEVTLPVSTPPHGAGYASLHVSTETSVVTQLTISVEIARLPCRAHDNRLRPSRDTLCPNIRRADTLELSSPPTT